MSHDADLLNQARAGCADAFQTLVGSLREPLLRVATLMTDDAEAEDLVQEALTSAFSGLARYEGRSKFSTWVYGILINHCRSHRRKRRHTSGEQAAIDAAPAPKGRKRGVLSSVLRRELAERMELAINALPATFKEAFVLHYVEGLPYDEIASITGERAATLRTRAHRARTLLRADLGSVVDTTWIREE
jgi:RNA polymerase sigma-70 factor (ECF subfamily)